MARIERKTKRYPTDLTDEEWEQIEPLLPKPAERGRKPSVDLCEVLNAIRLYDAHGRRLANASEGLPALANGVLVVSALRTTDAFSHHPQHRPDAGS